MLGFSLFYLPSLLPQGSSKTCRVTTDVLPLDSTSHVRRHFRIFPEVMLPPTCSIMLSYSLFFFYEKHQASAMIACHVAVSSASLLYEFDIMLDPHFLDLQLWFSFSSLFSHAVSVSPQISVVFLLFSPTERHVLIFLYKSLMTSYVCTQSR